MFERRDKSIPVIFTFIALFGASIFILYSDCKDSQTLCHDWSIGRESVGIHSRELGSVTISNEKCKIIETYLIPACHVEDGSHYRCKGTINICESEQVLTRLTVCPNFQHENQVNQVYRNKSHHEEIK